MRTLSVAVALSLGMCFAQADWTYGQPLTDVGIYKYSNGDVLWYFTNGDALLDALTTELGFAPSNVRVKTVDIESGGRHRLKRQHVLSSPNGDELGTISVYAY